MHGKRDTEEVSSNVNDDRNSVTMAQIGSQSFHRHGGGPFMFAQTGAETSQLPT